MQVQVQLPLIISFLYLQETVEPIHDLKQGIEDLRCSRTFRYILAMLLNIGNFLNGVSVRACLFSFHPKN